jgi:hypothetical protein
MVTKAMHVRETRNAVIVMPVSRQVVHRPASDRHRSNLRVIVALVARTRIVEGVFVTALQKASVVCCPVLRVVVVVGMVRDVSSLRQETALTGFVYPTRRHARMWLARLTVIVVRAKSVPTRFASRPVHLRPHNFVVPAKNTMIVCPKESQLARICVLDPKGRALAHNHVTVPTFALRDTVANRCTRGLPSNACPPRGRVSYLARPMRIVPLILAVFREPVPGKVLGKKGIFVTPCHAEKG